MGSGGRVDTDDRARLLESRSGGVHEFSDCEFMASVKMARITPGGEMEVTLSVPLSEKYRAITLTDAGSIMLLVQVSRAKGGRRR